MWLWFFQYWIITFVFMNNGDLVIRNRDGYNSDNIQNPITIVLDRLRSAFNVGNIFRIAEMCAAEQVITCGYTATPPHPKLSKTAVGTEEIIPSSHYETSLEAIQSLRKEGFQIIGIETVEGAPDIWDVELDFPVAFIFGNEALGIQHETLEACDVIAQLPSFGWKNSLNVANCAAVVVYQAIQHLQQLKKNSTDFTEELEEKK